MRYTPLLLLLALRSYAQTTTLAISEDGNCGLSFSQTCLDSRFGDCCSGKGFCGSTTDYCGADCQDGFGSCTSANSTLISSNGNCGATDPEGQICLNSTFGNCCSEKGFCGSTSDYCGTGCQGDYGNCGSNEGATNTATTTSIVSSTSNGTSASSRTESPATSTTSSSLPQATTNTPSQNDTQAASDQSAEPASDDSMPSGAIAGVAVGAVGGAAILVGAIFLVLRRRRQRKQGVELDGGEPLPPKSATSVSAMTSDSGSVSPYEYPPMPLAKGQMQVSELAEKGEERAELSAAPGTYSRTAGAPAELPTERYS